LAVPEGDGVGVEAGGAVGADSTGELDSMGVADAIAEADSAGEMDWMGDADAMGEADLTGLPDWIGAAEGKMGEPVASGVAMGVTNEDVTLGSTGLGVATGTTLG
jgi:hypothetical protein